MQRRRLGFVASLSLALAGVACNGLLGLESYSDTPPSLDGSTSGQLDSATTGANSPDGTTVTIGPDAMSAGDDDGPDGATAGDDASGDDEGGVVVTPPSDAGILPPPDAGSDADCADGSYCALVRSDLPVAYFRFDQVTGGVQNPSDWSGHGARMGVSGGASTGPSAPVGDNGAGVTFVSGSTFKLVTADGGAGPTFAGAAPFTFEVWFELPASGVGESGTIKEVLLGNIVEQNHFGNLLEGFQLNINDDNDPHLQLCNGSCVDTKANNPVPKGAFVHLAGTYDGTLAFVYFNGVAGASQRAKNGVGVGSGLGSTEIIGTIDELAIYDHALAAARILAHAQYKVH